MLKSEQARVIKAFENILHKTENMQGRRIKTAQNSDIAISEETQKALEAVGVQKDVENESDIVYNKNTEQYRVMWTIEEGILSKQEVSVFYELIGEKKRGIYFPKAFEDETIFEINNKLVYADTDYYYPSISKVITINNLDTPELKQCIEVIINGEEIGIESAENYSFAEIVYGEGTVSSADFVDSKAYRREKDGRRKRDGSGTFDSRSGKNVLKSKPDIDVEYLELAKNPEQNEERLRELVDDAAKNAVLLDTIIASEPSSRMGKSSIFVHHLYCPIKVDGKEAIAKIYVAEKYDGGKKFYLTKIEKMTSDTIGYVENKNNAPQADKPISNVTVISVSKLFDFVKKNDVNYESDSKHPVYFKPQPSSVVVNDDGTPKVVYHGAHDARIIDNEGKGKNGTIFTVFDPQKSAYDDVEGYNYFASNKRVAQAYGKPMKENELGYREPYVYETYINLKNPLIIDGKGAAWNNIKVPDNVPKPKNISWYDGKEYTYETAKTEYFTKYAKDNNYDGVIFKNIIDYDASNSDMIGDVYAVFDSNNIKSVDNQGTFSSWDNDIMKSKPETDTETTSTEVSKASVTVLPSLKISKETQAKLDEFNNNKNSTK